MTVKHLKNKPLIEKVEDFKSYHVLAKALADDEMTNDEFNKAMAALENIWSVCPADLPKDLSAKHNHYLFGDRK
jgi:hypothetical protein